MPRPSLISALMFALALMAAAPAALAADKTVSPALVPALQQAQTLLKSDPKGALQKIAEAEAAEKKTDYDTLIINQLKVAAYAQLNDGADLATAAEAVLANPEAPEDKKEMYRNAALQGYLQAGNVAKAAEYAKGNPDLQVQLAQAYVKQGKYADGESLIREAIAAAGGTPKEEWLLALYDAQNKGGKIDAAGETVQKLLKANPKPEYWRFVLGNMLNKGGLSDKQRLDVYRLFYATNSFSAPSDYEGMAETAMRTHSPGDAKAALEKGFSAGTLSKGGRAGQLYATATQRAADDRATLPKIEAQAAAQANGDALMSIGEGYLSYGQYDKAIGMLQQAIAKGVSDPNSARLHLGIAYAGASQPQKARASWSAIGGRDINKQLAGLWPLTLK